MTQGIYAILHKPSARWYVGASTQIEKRWDTHELVRLFPEHDLAFFIVEVVPKKEMLLKLETIWMVHIQSVFTLLNVKAGKANMLSEFPNRPAPQFYYSGTPHSMAAKSRWDAYRARMARFREISQNIDVEEGY